MLGFFRRYEKTFLLIIFVPSIIGMGITGAVFSAFSFQDPVVGKVFGEEITASQSQRFEQAYLQTNPSADPETAWRFMALQRAADRAGIRVSDAEVGKLILENTKFDIARFLAEEEMIARKIDPSTDEGRKEFNAIFMRHITEARDFDPAVYRRYAEAKVRGGSVRQYEEQERREALVSRYLDTLRELGTVTPAEVHEEFQSQNHRRVLELVTVQAKDHLPSLDEKDEKAPGFVSDAQVRQYYDMNVADYDIPRRARVEVLGVELSTLDFEKPDAEAGRAYLDAHRDGIADVGTTDFDDITDEQRTAIYEAIEAERRTAKADQVMHQVALAIEAAEAKQQKPDLAAIDTAVSAATKAELVYLSTDLTDRSVLDDHPVFGGFASRNWFDRKGDIGETSDVLAGEKGWFVIRLNELQFARTPEYDQVKAQVRADYAQGSTKELKRHYETYKNTRYAGEESYRLETAVAADAAFGGDHAKAREAIEKFHAEAKAWPRNVEWAAKLPAAVNIPTGIDAKVKEFTKTALAGDAVLAPISSQVQSLAAMQDVSEIVEAKDKSGWIVARVTKRIPPEVQPFDQVKDKVTDAVRLARGLERARTWAEETLLPELAGLTDEALAKALAERKLTATKTAPVARDDTTIEGLSDAGQVVADAFASDAKVGGPFAHVQPAGDSAVVLIRVLAKDDAPEAKYAEEYTKIRGELLTRKRGEFASERTTRTFLEAKGISEAHVRYSMALRDGPGNAKRVKLRQIYLQPDKATLDAWLEVEAKKRLAEAQAELAAGKSFEAVVDRFSEDDPTRARGGRLPPVSRGDLITDFGIDFEEAAFSLADGGVSQPVKSRRGYHLVKRVNREGARVIVAHVLIKTDPETRRLPKEVQDKAEAIARTKMEEAARRLDGGAAFGLVAREVGDKEDMQGTGQEFEVDYVTPFERAALASLVEWEPPEGSPEAKDMAWVPNAVEVAGPDANSWHLIGCGRDRMDRGAPGGQQDRTVTHIAAPTREAIEAVRDKLARWMKEKVQDEDDRPSWGAIHEKLRELARDYSKAPDAAKGGELGAVQLEGSVRPYGTEFLEKVMGAAPPKAGSRVGPFRSATGWHIVEVVEVTPAGPERFTEVARAVLDGTDWR